MNKRLVLLLSLMFMLMFAGRIFADGLGTLIDVAQSQGAIAKQYKEETRAYEEVKKGIDRGDVKAGQDKTYITKRYGKPVVVLEPRSWRQEKWIYKPSGSSFFKGEKISLVFDEKGFLVKVEKE